MAYSFTLPDLGEGIVEAVIVRWHVEPGEVIAEGDPLLEVETDKAIVEIPSPRTGTVERLEAERGERVSVGSVLVVIATDGERPAAPERMPAPRPTQAHAQDEPPVELGAVRGRLVRHLEQVQREVPAVTVVDECDFGALERELAGFERTAFLVKAASAALADVPELNATFADGRVTRRERHHIGVAVQTPGALLVPVVREVDRRPPAELATDLRRLTEGARKGSLTPAELRGSTFTVTDAGPFGSLFATPLLNAPEVGLLGLHRVEDRPVARGGEVVVARIGHVSCTFDHRAVDGFHADLFLRRFIELAQQPEGPIQGDGAEPDPALAERLAAATEAEREQILLGLVRERAAALASQSADAVDPAATFKDLGLDSAAMVELRNLLSRATGLRLEATVAFDYPTCEGLAEHLMAELER